MKKVMFFVVSLLLLVSCDSKSDDNNGGGGNGSGDFTITPATVQLVRGESKRLTVQGVSASTSLLWESSDSVIAQVDNRGNVLANEYVTGNVTITCRLANNKETYATCEVNVITFASIATFDNNVFWYSISYDHGLNNNGDSLGIIGFYILSQGLYANESGKLDGNGGLLIDIEAPYRFLYNNNENHRTIYVLGTYEITDDPYDTIRTSDLAELKVLAGTFDEAMFLEYYTKALFAEEGEPEVDPKDYPYLVGQDVVDVQPKTTDDGYDFFKGGYVQTNSSFTLLQNAETYDLYVASYDLNCVTYSGWHGLALEESQDESTGERGLSFAYPLQFAAESHHYVKVDETENSNAKTKGIPAETIERAIRFNKAMFSVMMTKLDRHTLYKK